MRGERAKVWWKADEGKVHERLFDHVHAVEMRQSAHFDRFQMLESMYDPNGPAAQMADPRWQRDLERITENVIASNVDTVRAAVSTTEVRAEFLTDGADWDTQKRAKDLEAYAEEVAKLAGVAPVARGAFGDGAMKGTGLAKVYADQNKVPRVEIAMVDNIVVDDAETQNGAPPRQLHYRQVDRDRDELIQQFPEHEHKINAAQSSGGWRRRWSRWVLPGSGSRNDVLVVESWRLPMGVYDEDGYVPGRHVICCEGCDLLDEEWHEEGYPFAVFRWSERRTSWYGISLAERIIGHQRVLNKRNWQRNRQLDLIACPTTYVRPADLNARVQTTQAGNFVPIKMDWPVTVVPTAVGAEMLQDRHETKASAFEETGVSRMAATSAKPAGLESGAALREWRDIGTSRFSLQEEAFERFWLDVILLLLGVCKALGKDAPQMSRKSRFAPRRLKWSDVDMGEVRVQIAAASTLNRTPAGRIQTVLEFAQSGVINMDEARRLLSHPDLEQALSLYTASLEAIEEDLGLIERGAAIIPEPFINLEMAVWRGQNRYLVDRGRGAPEEVLEGIYTYVTQAAYLVDQKNKAMMPPPGGPGALPGGPGVAGDAGAIPPLPGAAMPAPVPMQLPQGGPPLGGP